MKVKVKVPTRMRDVKVSQYQQWIAVAEKEGQPAEFLEEKIIQYFTGLPQLAVMRLKRSQYNEILTGIKLLMSEEPPLTPIIEINGKEYGFIPNLEKDTIFAEWVDLDLKMANWATMHEALAILYRPIVARKGDRYTIEEYDHNKTEPELFKDVSLDIGIGAVLFFWNLSNQLLRITPKYLSPEAMTAEIKAALDQSGVGMDTYTTLLGETCLNLTRLLPSHWGPFYFGSLMTGTIKEKLDVA